MQYDFDKIIDRYGSNDIKHVALEKMFGRSDLIPLWVADMEFETPPFITDALRRRLEHSLFGYTALPADYWQCVAKWVNDHHQWLMKTEWLRFIPGIVKGIGFAVNVFTKPGDKVMILSPVYHPFRLVPEGNCREVVQVPLKENVAFGNEPDADGRQQFYSIDFEALEHCYDERCKMLILSNPHNPVGICWSRETLVALARWCKEHGVIVISDEIHSDMAVFGKKHIPFAAVSEEAEQNSITFAAPSKTFNIAGIVSSWAAVPNDDLRARFFGWLDANEMSAAHLFAPIATMAAFEHGEDWRQQMLRYVENNIRFVEEYCKENIPSIRPIRPEASFLVWLDCREMCRELQFTDANGDIDQPKLFDFFVSAGVALNDGGMFGKEGRGFMRLNVGEPRSMLAEALKAVAANYRCECSLHSSAMA